MDTAKLITIGRSQAVQLPKQYRFSGKRVYIRKFGKGVLLIPEEESWDTLVESISQFTDDFLSDRNQGGHEKRETSFE